MLDEGGVVGLFVTLCQRIEAARKFLGDSDECRYSKKWSTKYINDLPNAAFAVVEKGYRKGKDKRGRHLPHHTGSVKLSTENSIVDLPHFKNVLSRVDQIKSVYGKESDTSLRKRAASHLEKHRAVLQTSESSFNEVELLLWEECENIFEERESKAFVGR